MTLNNLAEQLPWLLRNPQATRPTGIVTAASAAAPGSFLSLTRTAGPSSLTAGSAAHSPTTAALIATFRKEPPLSAGNLTATAVGTPSTSNAAAGLPTPASTGTTLVPSLRQIVSAKQRADVADRDSSTLARKTALSQAVRQLPPPALPSLAWDSDATMASHTPSRRHQLAQQSHQAHAAPAPSRGGNLGTPAHGLHSATTSSTRTPDRMTPSIPSSRAKRAKAPVGESPYSRLDFESDLDLEDFDAIVDLTTDDNAPSSSPPNGTPCKDIRLWRDDYTSRTEPLAKRGKKRKSLEISGNASASPAAKATPASKKKAKAKADKMQQSRIPLQDGDGENGDDSVGYFPDINDLVGCGASSPVTLRKGTPAKTPAKSLRKLSPLRPPDEHAPSPGLSVTPQKKKKRESVRSDVVMDSEDEFVTPPTRRASYVSCPNDTSMDDMHDDGQPSPHYPILRAQSRVADTPHKDSPAMHAPKTPRAPEATLPHDCDDVDMDHGIQVPDSSMLEQPRNGSSLQPGPRSENAPVTNGVNQDVDSGDQPGVLGYWPALRWKQHQLEEKIQQNTADYMQALREKWPPARRLQIKGEKEPLLKTKQTLDGLVNGLKSYARLYNDQEALLHLITEAYQRHQDTEEQEARLDELSVELQEREEALQGQLSAAAIDPASCPSGFAAGSPHDTVVPATQHPVRYQPPMLSRNNTMVSENPSQIVLQTQMPPPRARQAIDHSWDWGSFEPPPPTPLRPPPDVDSIGMANNTQDYFDDDDLFAEMENMLPIHGSSHGPSTGFSSNYGLGTARLQNMRPPPPPASRGHDLFSDFSDDVEMLQAAEDFELQHSSSAEASRGPAPMFSRAALALTSGNAGMPPSSKDSTLSSAKRAVTTSQKASMPAELMRFEWSQDVRRALKDRFRMSCFRHNQLEAINATLSGKDAFVLMPTGGGKSLCYQLPAVLSSGKTNGVTIVISPLLSLMQDQVDHLKALNIAASAFNSSTPAAARKHVLALFSKANPEHFLQLLYVTPEMVNKSAQFVSGLATLYRNKKLARIVIDEAHCVSQWGHDFRPDYKALGTVRRQFPRVPVMALTATATPNVIVDIKHNLSIDGCKVFSQSFNRPNLYYEVREKGKGCVDSIGELINAQYSGQTGIVYTLSQKSTVSIAEKLRTKFGISAHHYHAGMVADEKAGIQRDWQSGRIKVVVATIAFGMGIDKPDVRFVVHYYLPKSLEGYYQETGRAGRDGVHSDCFLYFGYGDIKNLRKFITDSDGSEAQKQRQREMLNRIVDFCENKRDCRRSEILRYFGEDFDKAGCKGTCDNCKNGGKFDLADFTEYAVAALQIVQEYKLITMVQCGDILQGKRKPEHASLEEVYGIAKKLKKQEIHMMIYRLLGESALKEENKVNRMDIAIQYFSLGHCARDFFSGRKKLHVVVKVSDDMASNTIEKATKKTRGAAEPGESSKAAKKAKTTRGKAAATAATAASKRKKSKGAAAAILDEVEVDDEDGAHGGSDSDIDDDFEGPLHANGYAKDNFVVSDNDDGSDVVEEDGGGYSAPAKRSRAKPRQATVQQYAFEDAAPSSSSGTSRGQKKSQAPAQRQRRLEELSGPSTWDAQVKEASIDPIHAELVSAFAEEARRLEEKIRNEKGLRVLFTESHLRKMAVGWTDSLDKMRHIPGIDVDNVRRYGAKFVPLVKRYFATYQEMMGIDGGGGGGGGSGENDSPVLGPVSAARRGARVPPSSMAAATGAATPSRAHDDMVVDLISSDDEQGDYGDADDDEGGDTNDLQGSHIAGSVLSAVESREAAQWRAQLETLQSQTTKAGSGSRTAGSGGGGGGRKSWGGRKVFRRGGSRSGSGSFARSRAASGSGGAGGGSGSVTKRKASGTSGSAASRSGGGASRSSGAGSSGVGMMPL